MRKKYHNIPDLMLKYVDKLEEHGLLRKISTKELSRIFGVSQKAAKRIMKYFRKTGIIKFQCAINYEKLGVFTALIAIKSLHPRHNEEITRELSKIRYIRGIYLLTGAEMTHLLRVRVPSFTELINLVEINLENLLDKIEWTQTMIVFKTYFDDGHLKSPPIMKGQYGASQVLDKKDWQILGILKYDSTIRLKDIADEIGLTLPATHRRIRNLIKYGIILGYYTARQWEKVSKISEKKPVRIICTFMMRRNSENRIISRLKQRLEKGRFQLSWLFTAFGIYDMIGSMRFNSINELRTFLDEFSRMNGILDVKAHILLDTKLRENFYEIADYHIKLGPKPKNNV